MLGAPILPPIDQSFSSSFLIHVFYVVCDFYVFTFFVNVFTCITQKIFIEDESLMKNRIRRQKHSSAEINGIITISLFLYAARHDYEWMTRFSFFSFFGRSRFSAAILK